MVAAAELLDEPLGVDAGFARWVGVVLLAWAGLLAWLSARSPISAVTGRAVAAANGLWIILSIAFAFADWQPLTGLGVAAVAAQAAAVLVLTELQPVGARRVATA
ncbi:MAG: hypothetical protein ACRDVZ_06350 [Jiangellaceae bacterium]